jgi:hypothetical protein
MNEAFKDVKLAFETLLNHQYSHAAKTAQKGYPDSSTGSPPQGIAGDLYWVADIPHTPLLFGQFLYYAGLITLDTLALAIAWQRRGRPSFGKIARMWGYLSEEDILFILTSGSDGQRIGESAVRTGRMTRFQNSAVLGLQQYMQRPIGEFFRKIGILREEEISYLVGLMKEHNNKVGNRLRIED